MKKRTRLIILNVATGVAIAAAATIVLVPGIAGADEARTNAPVSVLNGPGDSYQPLGTIQEGANVDVSQCQADFCYVTLGPVAGWVPEENLDMKIGSTDSGGVTVEIAPSPEPAPVPPPPPPGPVLHPGNPGYGPGPDYGPGPGPDSGPFPRRPHAPGFATSGDVCFFSQFNFRGSSFCMDSGDSQQFLGDWSDTIRSIDNPDGHDVRVCMDPGFRHCRVYTSSARSLGTYDLSISSASID
jgi:hypothetical protein